MTKGEKIVVGVVAAAAVVGVGFLLIKSASAANPGKTLSSNGPAPGNTIPPAATAQSGVAFILSGDNSQRGSVPQGRVANFSPPPGGKITNWDVGGMSADSTMNADGSVSIKTDQTKQYDSYQLTFEFNTSAGVAYSQTFQLSIT